MPHHLFFTAPVKTRTGKPGLLLVIIYLISAAPVWEGGLQVWRHMTLNHEMTSISFA